MGMKKLAALVMALVLCLAAVGAMAATVEVTTDVQLKAAIESAGSGDVIKLKNSMTGGGIDVPEGKNITIDFNNCVYTVTGNPVGSTGTKTIAFRFLKNSTITLQNGVLKAASNSGVKMLIQNYATLTVKDMILDGNGLEGTNRYVLSNNNCIVNVTGDTSIVAKDGDFALDVCDYAPYYTTDTKVTINTTGEIIGKIEVAGKADTPAKTELIIKNVSDESLMEITVEGGSAELSNVPSGVTVKNVKDATVKVNGISVADGAAYAVPYPAQDLQKMPKTGDESSMMLWACVMMMAMAGFVLVSRKTRLN